MHYWPRFSPTGSSTLIGSSIWRPDLLCFAMKVDTLDAQYFLTSAQSQLQLGLVVTCVSTSI